MGKFYDEDDQEVVAFSEDEHKKIVEEEVKKKIEETKADYEKRLSGQADADRNWAALRAKVDRKENLTEEEKRVFEERKKLEEDKKTFQERIVDSWRDRALDAESGGNKELRDKASFYYKSRLTGEPMTEDEIRVKAREAVALAKYLQATPDALGQAIGMRGGSPQFGKKEENFAETEGGTEIMEKLHPGYKESLKKGEQK